MKQKIYEIPIWDAYQLENCECPLCSIEKKCDDDFIDALFTEMVMDVRLNPHLVKDYDFCHNHFEKLYRYPDKCGLAILTNRILYSKRETLKQVKISNDTAKKASIKNIFIKNKTMNEDNHAKECLLCNRLKDNMYNYIDTLLLLWSKDEKFKELYEKSSGFCIKHYRDVLQISSSIIKNENKLNEFQDITFKLQEKNLERLQNELEWFISKFDYRFTNEPWKTSKDSLIRTIQKLIGNYNMKI